jgi:hypothetical protein
VVPVQATKPIEDDDPRTDQCDGAADLWNLIRIRKPPSIDNEREKTSFYISAKMYSFVTLRVLGCC